MSVHNDGGPLEGAAAQPRRLAVLALVARGGERGTTRSKVLALLWPDADDAQGRRVLSQALYSLRRDLGNEDCISGKQDLRLNTESVWCDVAAFEDALANGALERAASLYVGPFLDGFRLASAPEFERWADDERTEIQHRFHDAVEQLARAAEIDGAFDVAVKWWRRRAADDPLNARVAVATMRALAAAGDRAGALREARLFEALIAQELELAPDRAVVELADQLRREPAIPRAAICVGVHPFTVLGAPTEVLRHEWQEGLAEEIVHGLVDIAGISVAGRKAGAVNATHAVEGSVRFVNNSVRVSLRVLDASRGHVIWSDRFSASIENAHTAQEEIASKIAKLLGNLEHPDVPTRGL